MATATSGVIVTNDTHSLGPALNGTQWTLVALATTVCICRLYVRAIRKRAAGYDDLTIAIATGLSIFGGVTGQIFTANGIGTHIWLLKPTQVMMGVKWLVIGVFQSYLALFFIRLSIGIFILRMISRDQSKIKLSVYFCLFLNGANTIMIVTLLSLWCRPLEKVWNPTVPGTCLSGTTLTRGNKAFGSISAATDILFAALPVAVFWKLQMNRRLKINLAIIMLFTLAICACAIGKAATVNESSPDATYTNGAITFWAVFEVNIGIIVASLPALRQFYVTTRDDITSLRSGSLSLQLLPRKRQNDDRNHASGSDSSLSRVLKAGRPTDGRRFDLKDNEISVRHDIAVDHTDRKYTSPPEHQNEWIDNLSGDAQHTTKVESV